MTDLNLIRETIKPFVTLTTYILVSGVGVAAVTQVLKDRRIPIPVTTYPRATAAAGAVLATLVSLYVGTVNLLLNTLLDYVGLAIVILIASTFSYTILFKGLDDDLPR